MTGREQQVYVVSVEIRPLKGSAQWGKAGGFVYCYTLATGTRDARERVSRALLEDHYAVIGIEWIRPEAKVEWDDEDAQEQRDYATQARASADVVYSTFEMYESVESPN